jgi:hypothetical protein
VRLQLGDPAALTPLFRELQAIDGVEALRIDGPAVLFDAHGDVNGIVRLAASREIAAIDIERPSLEEVFLTYYDTSAPAPAATKEA